MSTPIQPQLVQPLEQQKTHQNSQPPKGNWLGRTVAAISDIACAITSRIAQTFRSLATYVIAIVAWPFALPSSSPLSEKAYALHATADPIIPFATNFDQLDNKDQAIALLDAARAKLLTEPNANHNQTRKILQTYLQDLWKTNVRSEDQADVMREMEQLLNQAPPYTEEQKNPCL